MYVYVCARVRMHNSAYLSVRLCGYICMFEDLAPSFQCVHMSMPIRNVISHAHIVRCAHCFWVFHFKAVAGDGGAIVVRGGPVQGEGVHSSSGEGGRVWGGGRTCPRMKLQYIAVGTRGNSLFPLKHIPKCATLEYTYKPGACQTGKAHAHLT